MTCKARINTGAVQPWRCPRPAEVFGYCGVHIPRHLYRIKYIWPSGKVRYRTEANLTATPQDAALYTFEEAEDIIRNKSRDARLVWDIITTKEAVE